MYKSPIYVLLFLLLSTIPISTIFAQKSSDFEMSYFEDVNAVHTFKSVTQENFKMVPNHIISLGYVKSKIWVKIKIDTASLASETVLKINNPFVDNITLLYALKGRKQVKESLGIQYPQSKNKFNHFVPVFSIPTKKMASQELYLKIESRYPMLIQVSIFSKEKFYKERITPYLIGGLLLGGLLLMGIYNLFLFFSTKDFSYILYVLALFSTILSQGYIYGILIPYMSPNSPEFTFRFPVIMMCFTGIFSTLFTLRFLSVKKTSIKLYYLLLTIITLFIINISLELMKFDFLSRKLNFVLVISSVLAMFSTALYSLIKKNKIAVYFTIAWSFYLLGIIVYAFKTIGFLPHNTFTSHFIHIGTFMEVLLLSFALGHKYSLVRLEKEKLEHQTREDLEQLVKIQVIKLEASLEEKEILLKEVHHRVKNNLQIIISLLDLQVASVKDHKSKDIIAQSKARVYSMSLIHQKLYQSNNLTSVNMKTYLDELFTYLRNIYVDETKNTTCNLFIDTIELSLTQAVPLGLIVNELLTNSFKYGVTKEKDNTINISLSSYKNELILKIADSGKGFEENKSTPEIKNSLGLFLVKSLSKQLRATTKRFYDNDLFITEITIPIKDDRK